MLSNSVLFYITFASVYAMLEAFNLCLDHFVYLSGVGLQCTAEEGVPECSDALWDASSGCFHQPVAGTGPQREI